MERAYVIKPDGTIIGLWCDSIVGGLEGAKTIIRASIVEADEAGNWWVKLQVGPNAGEFLAEGGFTATSFDDAKRWPLREEALTAENKYFNKLIKSGELTEWLTQEQSESRESKSI